MPTASFNDLQYKYDNYAVRPNDAYALSKYQIIQDWLPQTNNLRVLEAGCGSGEMTALLARHSSWEIDAIDIDPEAIRLTQTLAKSLALTNVHFHQVGIEAHSGRNYDIIISNDVVEHISDDVQAVKNLVQMLKPGGILCLSVPALQWLFGYHDYMLGHYRRYNRRHMINLLSPYVNVKHCRYFGFSLIPIAVIYSLLFKKQYPVRESTGASLWAHILNRLLTFERKVALPGGTSLLAMGVMPE